jgi:hypothetical protein
MGKLLVKKQAEAAPVTSDENAQSQLGQWPCQLKLTLPLA